MRLGKPYLALLMQRLEAAFAVTLPAASLREGADEITTSRTGFPEADVSSLSIALYQMGLCKHLPDASPTPPITPSV